MVRAKQFFPTFCTQQDFGEIYLSNLRQSTYRGGVELGPVRVSAQTDFTTYGATGWDFKTNDRFLCGETHEPGLPEPGRVMADYKDR